MQWNTPPGYANGKARHAPYQTSMPVSSPRNSLAPWHTAHRNACSRIQPEQRRTKMKSPSSAPPARSTTVTEKNFTSRSQSIHRSPMQSLWSKILFAGGASTCALSCVLGHACLRKTEIRRLAAQNSTLACSYPSIVAHGEDAISQRTTELCSYITSLVASPIPRTKLRFNKFVTMICTG